MIQFSLRTAFALLCALGAGLSHAQQTASIPLTEQRMPSDDLSFQGRTLRADEAWKIKQAGVDLSGLSPVASAIWSNQKTELTESLDELPVNEGDTADFGGPLLSDLGLFRFNIRTAKGVAIVHLSKTLHTMLLRKNLLRLLGYKVPEMKWIKRLTVKFVNADELKLFMESQIPRATNGAASRWIDSKDVSGSTLTLHDVAVTVPESEDHYNVSQGVPPKTLTGRTLRSLIIPYALLNLGESVNELEWTVGRISNNSIQLPHFTRGNFTTTMDDAKWMLRRLEALTKEDIAKAVELAHFPHEAQTLLIEKLASRRNSLMDIFGHKTTPLDADVKIEELPNLKNGKLLKEDWEGWASRFAHGDPDSPFKDIHLYALSLLQSFAIDNLVGNINSELNVFDPNKVRGDFYHKQFLTGLNHFVETGEFLQFGIGTWTSPILAPGLNASRDVVIGNYLGTDNLVQLADSLGWSVNLGVQIGFENTGIAQTVGMRNTVSISQNWTHLKPLSNLKQVFKEDYKNMLVPLIKWQLGSDMDRLQELGKSTNSAVDWNLDKDNSALSQAMKHINDTLGVGESLLYTERLAPTVAGTISSTLMGTPVTFKLTASADMVELRRIQIYRKDAKTLQIYDDRGEGYGWNVDFTVERFIPILRLGKRQQAGDYTVKMHEVDINSSLKDNPKLFDKAHAVMQFIRSGSAELLEAIQKPHVVKVDYNDRSSRLAFLFWRHKKLKTDAIYDIQSRDDLKGKYVLFTDESQSGLNWEAFTKDLINYGISRLTKDVDWAAPVFLNPAQTIGGTSKTKTVRFEARVTQGGGYDSRFMRLEDEWEGWSESVTGLQKYMRAANAKFGFTLFDEGTLNNASGMKLYDVIVALNLYEEGITRLSKIPMDSLIRIEYRLETGVTCPENQIKVRRLSSGQEIESCGALNSSIWYNRECQSKIRKGDDEKSITRCLMKLYRSLYDELNYTDITSLLGEENVFVHGSINGFRKNDEILNDPIQSNTHGRIGGAFWNGPFEKIQQLLGIQTGELNGFWLREKL